MSFGSGACRVWASLMMIRQHVKVFMMALVLLGDFGGIYWYCVLCEWSLSMVSANYQWAGVIMILDGGPFFFFFGRGWVMWLFWKSGSWFAKFLDLFDICVWKLKIIIWKYLWKYVWVKKCIKLRKILFKNWKWLFENTNQTLPLWFGGKLLGF